MNTKFPEAVKPKISRNAAILLLAMVASFALLITFSFLPVHAQTAQSARFDKNGRMPKDAVPALMLWSPSDIGMSAAVLPASLSVSSTIIFMENVHSSTLTFNCGQNVDVLVTTYAEDGNTALGQYTINATAVPGWQQVYIATELSPNVTSGTNTIGFRLPQKAISFQFLNKTATPSTCTARYATNYF